MPESGCQVATWPTCPQVRHPRIIKLFEAYVTDMEVMLVMELATGGELLDRCRRVLGPDFVQRAADPASKHSMRLPAI